MVAALTYVLVSIVVLIVLTFVYVIEDRKGERVFLLAYRQKLDEWISKAIALIERFMFSLSNGVVRLLLHYGAHSILKRVLAFIQNLEERVEDLVRKNRRIAKSISALRAKAHTTDTVVKEEPSTDVSVEK
jgi:hypothetical protein